MWTAERPRSAELKQDDLDRIRRQAAAQDADQNHQEHREFDAFCSLHLAVIFGAGLLTGPIARSCVSAQRYDCRLDRSAIPVMLVLIEVVDLTFEEM